MKYSPSVYSAKQIRKIPRKTLELDVISLTERHLELDEEVENRDRLIHFLCRQMRWLISVGEPFMGSRTTTRVVPTPGISRESGIKAQNDSSFSSIDHFTAENSPDAEEIFDSS